MSFDKISNSFIKYILEQQKGSEISKRFANGEDISIFDYAEDFESYIQDELNLSDKYSSMDIEDFLNMEIEDGQFVENPETDVEDVDGTDTTIPSMPFPEILPEEDTENVEDSEEVEQTEESEDKKDVEENDKKNILKDILNFLLQDKKVIEAVDTDKDGKLSQEEINNFLEEMKDLDGNDKDISIKDVLGSLDKLQEKLGKETPELKEKPELETPEMQGNQGSEEVSAPRAQQSGNSAPSSGGGSFGNSGGNNNDTDLLTKDPSQMTLKELEATAPKASEALTEKQNLLNETIDGSTPAMQGLQANIDTAFNSYMELLENVETEDETFAKDIAAKKEEIDTQKQTINDKDKAIEGKNSEIETHKSDIQTAESSISSLNSTKSALQSALSNEDADTAAINGQISAIENQIAELEEFKAQAKEDLSKAEEEKTQLEKEKTEAETKLTEFEGELTELENLADEAHPEVAEARQAYDEATKTYDTEKANAVSEAKADVSTAQTYLNEVSAKITEFDTHKFEKDSLKEAGVLENVLSDEVIEELKKHVGNGVRPEYLANTGLSTAQLDGLWCAAFVKYIVENSEDYENEAADWYKNMPNDRKSSCPSIFNAAKEGGALVNLEDAQPGQFILYDWNSDGGKDHIGIITDINEETGEYTVIEGNATGGIVRELTYKLNDVNFMFDIVNPYKD